MRVLTTALLTTALFAGCGGGAADKTERVRGLSQGELAEIYTRLDEIKHKGAPLNLRSQQIPPVVARLQPEGVMIRGNTALIHLSGAFDDKMCLFVNGLGNPQGDRSIVLSTGEREPQQVLWRQSR